MSVLVLHTTIKLTNDNNNENNNNNMHPSSIKGTQKQTPKAIGSAYWV